MNDTVKGVLAVFAFLGIIGISESAVVALGIFLFHLATLTLPTVACGFIVVRDPTLLLENWHLPSVESLPRMTDRALPEGRSHPESQ